MNDSIKDFWEKILSENPQLITSTFNTLDPEEKQYTLVHLYKMFNEPGWHPSQVQSALEAIKVIEEMEIEEQ